MDTASKGDMSLYSPSKNIRIQALSKQKVAKSDITKFNALVDTLQPSIAVLIRPPRQSDTGVEPRRPA